MNRERISKPVAPLQRAPELAAQARVPAQPVKPGHLPRTLEAQPVTPAHLELQRAQQLEIQRLSDLELQRAVIQRAHDDRSTNARAAQSAWRSSSLKSIPLQRDISDHTRSARAARDTRAAFLAQRSSELLETLVAQRLELEVRPALPSVQRQAGLTLSHVADHLGSQAAVQLGREPEHLSSYAGFKNTGAGLVKNFRTPGSSHTMPELAKAIGRFREPMQRAAVESAVYAAFGSHPTYPKQLQRALEERDANLEVQREAWQRELEPVAQRQALEEAGSAGATGMIEQARGSGQPLPAGVRAMLETKWNTDLSKVRIHTDSSANLISKKLNAKALTTGSDIFFGAGTWNPTSLEGLQLIAHEAWHTVQQAQGLVRAGVDRDQGLEGEARAKGSELSSGDLQTSSGNVSRVTRMLEDNTLRGLTGHAPLTLKAVQRQAAPITAAPTRLPVAPTTGADIAYDTLVARLVALLPEDMRPHAASSLPLLLQQSRQSDLRNPDQVAYILATARHEARFGQPRYARSEPLVEDHNPLRTRRVPENRVVNGRNVRTTREEPYRVSHVTNRTIEGDNLDTYYDDAYGGRLGNVRGTSDAADFRGRGLVQLTGRSNYGNMAQQLTREGFQYTVDGVTYGTAEQPINLIANPTHVNRVPELAARITVSGMRQGTFTGRGLDDHITNETSDFFNARRIVNGDRNTVEPGRIESNGEIVAGYARAFAAVLREGDAWKNLFPSDATAAPVQRAESSI